MQLLQTSYTFAALRYLPIPSTGLVITSFMFSFGTVVPPHSVLALLIRHEHIRNISPHYFGIQVGIRMSLAELIATKTRESELTDILPASSLPCSSCQVLSSYQSSQTSHPKIEAVKPVRRALPTCYCTLHATTVIRKHG